MEATDLDWNDDHSLNKTKATPKDYDSYFTTSNSPAELDQELLKEKTLREKSELSLFKKEREVNELNLKLKKYEELAELVKKAKTL